MTLLSPIVPWAMLVTTIVLITFFTLRRTFYPEKYCEAYKSLKAFCDEQDNLLKGVVEDQGKAQVIRQRYQALLDAIKDAGFEVSKLREDVASERMDGSKQGTYWFPLLTGDFRVRGRLLEDKVEM